MLCCCLQVTLEDAPLYTFLWDEGSSVRLPPSAPHVCCSGFLSLSPPSFSPHPPLPQDLRAALTSTASGWSQHPGPGEGPGDPRPGTQGPGPELRTGWGLQEACSPPSPLPASAPAPPTLTAPAVQLRWGLSTWQGRWAGSRAGPVSCAQREPAPAAPALPEPARVLPARRAPLSRRQAEVEGTLCQGPGTSLNPHAAGTCSLPLRQHIWLPAPLPGACEGRPSALLLLLL